MYKPEMYCCACGCRRIGRRPAGFSAGSALAGGLLAGPIGLLAGCIGSKKLEPYCLECGSGAVTDQPPMGLGAHWLAFWLIAGGLLLLAVLALLE